MRYLLLFRAADFRGDYQLRPGEQEAIDRWCAEVTGRGGTITGRPLRPAAEAASVRASDDGGVLRTDGPFAETKEVVGGFEIVACGSLDEAAALAARHPVAGYGCIEVRELAEPDAGPET